NPLERPPALGRRPDETEEEVRMEAEGPFAALCFKVQLFEGRRHVFARIYRGRLEAGQEVAVGGRDIKERAARLFEVDANKKSRTDEAVAGQIVLLAGLRHATTGDTI